MAIYYIILLSILILGYVMCEKFSSKRNNIIYLALIFALLWCVATFRKGIGFDYQTYINIFEEIRGFNNFEAFKNSRFEIGFTLLTKFMTFFISSSVVMYGVYNILILAPIAYFIYKHSDCIWLSCWLYVTLALFYTNMNFIRQSLACSICALAFGFFISKETVEVKLPFMNKLLKREDTAEVFTINPYKHAIPFLLMALLAISFHKTAIIIIPIYIVSRFKLNKISISIYAVVALLLSIFSEQIVNFIMNHTDYDYYRGTDYITKKLGVEFLLVPITVLVLCAAVYYFWRDIDPRAGILLNVSIMNATIWLFGATRHMIIERFSMYSYVYTLIIVPSALRALLAKPSEVEEYHLLAADVARKGNVPKSVKAKLNQLEAKISDHKKYYISALVAILLITFIYNYFGMYVNGFHAVFPYTSVFGK